MINKKVLLFIICMCLGLAINISFNLISGITEMISCFISIAMITVITAISLYNAWKHNDVFQPITIINIMLFFIFVLRPIQILLMESLKQASYFRYYFLLYGEHSISELPFAEALLIGLMGIIGVNSGYLITRQKTKFNKLKVSSYKLNERRIKNAKEWINVYVCFATLILMFYIYKSFSGGNQVTFSTIDILWIYIFCVSVLLEQIIKEKISFKIWMILLVSILAFSVLGNRQHIINLLLCVFIPYSYMNKKSINKKTIFLGITMVFVIVWYGSLRRGNEFTINTMLEYFLGEFSMFDMLVLGLDHKIAYNDGFYYGYNYLCFLNYIIPSLEIEFFDFRHVQDVFNGLIGGGIPSSIIGSLYFNFSYIGTIVGSFLMGIFVGDRYNKYIKMNTSLSIAYYSIFLTFIYDVTRVGDIGREIINYFILFGCFKIALLFIDNKEAKSNKYLRKEFKYE